MAVNQPNQIAYGLSSPLINVFPLPIVSLRTPTTADKAQIGTLWIYTTGNAAYVLTSIVNNLATWENLSGGAGVFTNLHVTGISLLDGAVTMGSTASVASLLTATGGITSPANIVTTGTGVINSATTMTAGTGITATTGNIVATAGQVNAGTTMTAGTGITATTGNITASGATGTFIASGASGGFSAPNSGISVGTISGGYVTAQTGNMTATAGGFIAGGGATPTAIAGQVAYGSNPTLGAGGSGVYVITGVSGAGNTVSSGFLQVNVAGTSYYVPLFASYDA
jgi:hypothetical protein